MTKTNPHPRSTLAGSPSGSYRPVLVVDIGNTRTKLARWFRGRLEKEVVIVSARSSVVGARAAAETAWGCREPGAAVLTSVVPAAESLWNRALRQWSLHWVSFRSPLGIEVSYRQPGTIGPDRLVNAAAAVWHGCPVVVADVGTALTVDVVLPKRGFVGGVIAPGPAALTDYLATRTARLPDVPFRRTARAIGRTTGQAIQAGVWFGYRGLLREILTEVLDELGDEDAVLCGTGGYARALLPDLFPDALIETRLTQRGLGEIGNRVFGG